METKLVVNGYCQRKEHEKCPVKSKGTKSDPVTFICICECHMTEKQKENLAAYKTLSNHAH
jgi:hypothetical protein